MNDQDVITATVKEWIETFVVALNVCPFAKRELAKNRVRYSVTSSDTRSDLTDQLKHELELMRADDSIETCLLIHPQVLTNFLDYNDYLCSANTLLHKMELEGVFQVASFHPDYQFAGTDPEDAENYTNRSPYPMLHLLRESSITRAIDQYPDSEGIPQRNISLLNSMGGEVLRAMLRDCMHR